MTSGDRERATSGNREHATSGNRSRVTVGHRGNAWALVARMARVALAGAVLGGAPALARAQSVTPAVEASAVPAPPRLVEVRFALSSSAMKQLSEPRLRRLLEIELGDVALLAPVATGPLGDHVAYVWIDLSEPSTVAIEVRVGVRTVERREIADAELTGDIAVRVIAIAAAEMVRAQMRPLRVPKKPAAPKPPSPEAIEAASRQADALMVNPRAMAAFIPSAGAWLFGPAVDLGFRRFGASAHLFTSWLTGPTEFGSARWFEVGLAGGYRLWASPSFRFSGELSASAAAVRVAGAQIFGEAPGVFDTWSARAGGSVAIEWRVREPAWLTLGVGPSALLRSFQVGGQPVLTGPRPSVFEGVFVGASLGVLFEERAPVHLKALQSSGVQ